MRISILKNRGIPARILTGFLAVFLCLSPSLPASAAIPEEMAYSEEYKGSEYYTKLNQALADTQGKSTMERVLAIACSQEGYKDYYMGNTTPEAAREAGYLWTGKNSGTPQSGSGNTEYTRWAQEYVMDRTGDEIYLDCDWCAIFASWCLFQAGYYSEDQLKRYFYSYYADPREERTASTWIEAFNFDPENVWYTSKAAGKVSAYSWSSYVHTDIDPYQLPYRPGGMIFFSWDASGKYFSHVGIVVSYDPDEHILTYINGNVEYAVTTRVMDLDADEEYHGQIKTQNANRIMAYAEYDQYSLPEKKTITADQTDFSWERGSKTDLTLKTDSASKTVLLTADCGFFDSNQTWPAQLILRYGEVTIGADLLDYLPDGENQVTLDFADGTLSIRITIHTPQIEAKEYSYVWNRNSKSGLTVETNSSSTSVTIYGDGFIGRSKTSDATIEDGIITLSPRLLNNMKDGEGRLTLVFGDGSLSLHITVYITGWQQEKCKWYYYTQDGQKKTGWLTVNDRKYYLDSDGARTTGWQQISGKWYYMDPEGVTSVGWKKISGQVYHFDTEGRKQTGWLTEGGKKYYLDADGARQTGWLYVNGNTFYCNADGSLVTGWKTLSGKRYYFKKNGVMKTGFFTQNGKKYYLDPNGVMATGWKTINKQKYYFNKKSGAMITGWKSIKGKQYYFNKKSGVMATGWKSIKGKQYYFNKKSGVMTTGWKSISGKKYYFCRNGAMAKNVKLKIDGKTYTFDKNGYRK